MNEFVTLARIRKPLKVELKAGDWVILSNPSIAGSEANSAFGKISTSPVNGDYERVITGRVNHTRPAQNLFTAKQQEERLKQVSVQTQRVTEIAGTARARSDSIEKDREEKIAVAHKDTLDKKNKLVENIKKNTVVK